MPWCTQVGFGGADPFPPPHTSDPSLSHQPRDLVTAYVVASATSGLSTHLSRSTLTQWRPTILANLKRLRGGVRGQPHIRNLDRWEALIYRGDVAGLRRVLTGLDREYIEMREVTPMSGLLSEEERAEALHELD